MKPKISILTGVRNPGPEFADTVSSLRRQTFEDWEWIVVDDGSGEEERWRLREMLRDEPRIRLIHAPASGLTRSLITASRAAASDLLARQDAGDRSPAGRFELQIRLLLAHPDAGFVSGTTRFYGPEWEFLWEERARCGVGTPERILDLQREHGVRGGPTHHGSVLMSRRAFEESGGYRAQFYFGQDWDLWYRIAERWKFLAAEECVYESRIFAGGISMAHRRLQRKFAALSLGAARARGRPGSGEESVLRRAEELGALAGRLPTSAPGRTADGYLFLGKMLLRKGNPAARKYLRKALSGAPWNPRVWLAWLGCALKGKR